MIQSRPREVSEYLTIDEKSPFDEWMKSLIDPKTRAIIRVRINRLRAGNFGDCKSVGEGVSELRIDYGAGYRVYFGIDGDVLVILLCGGSKKTQQKDIRQAQQYWKDYRKRLQHG